MNAIRRRGRLLPLTDRPDILPPVVPAPPISCRAFLAGRVALLGASTRHPRRVDAAVAELEFAPAPGTIGPPPTLPVAGPLARSATDLLLALQALGRPDDDDARAYRWTLPPARGAHLTDHRVGSVLDDPRCPLSADVGDVMVRSIDALRKARVRREEGWPDG